jgi:hypothetical protein
MIFWSCCHDKIFATSGLCMKKNPFHNNHSDLFYKQCWTSCEWKHQAGSRVQESPHDISEVVVALKNCLQHGGCAWRKIPCTTTLVMSSINNSELFVNWNTMQVRGFKNQNMIFLKELLRWYNLCNIGSAWRILKSRKRETETEFRVLLFTLNLVEAQPRASKSDWCCAV